MVKQFDILVSVKGELEWICEIYCDDLNEAIAAAIEMAGPAEYVGHNAFALINNKWEEWSGSELSLA